MFQEHTAQDKVSLPIEVTVTEVARIKVRPLSLHDVDLVAADATYRVRVAVVVSALGTGARPHFRALPHWHEVQREVAPASGP